MKTLTDEMTDENLPNLPTGFEGRMKMKSMSAKPSDGFAVTDETRMKPSDSALLSATPSSGRGRPA